METEEKRAKVKKQVIEYLTQRKFKEASLAVASFEAEQARPRGLGIDWKNYNPDNDIKKLKTIFEGSPKILSHLDKHKLDTLRIAAAMMTLWGNTQVQKWLTVDFETDFHLDKNTSARMLVFYATHRAALEQYRSEGLKYVEILPAPDSCEACKKLANRHYKLNEVPELPHEKCTHKLGCRCTFLPVV